MLSVKLHGNDLLNADIISPPTVVASFKPGYTGHFKKEVELTINHGALMLAAYNRHRDNLHVANVARMIEEMERIHREHEYAMFVAFRTLRGAE